MAWQKSLALPTTPVSKVIEKIDKGALQICLITDKQRKLLGTVTDGDVRRGLLKGIPLSSAVSKIMNHNPITASPETDPEQIKMLMQKRRIHQLPIVDKSKRLVDVKILDELIKKEEHENWVVLMAGGLGKRLRPLTDSMPKPLLPVGAKPLLETILENFIAAGFKNFFISVNFRHELIRDYFKNGRKWNVNIRYIKENRSLGTAGALSLLPSKPKNPVIVMNGDLLTSINFGQLLKFHADNASMATMAVREYDLQVPYGVIKLGDHKILKIDEKPVQRFFVNAGVYVLEPWALKLIPKNRHFDMPQLFDILIRKKMPTTAFPIREYWMDIGHINDLKRANSDYFEVFGQSRNTP